jgi:hypothetical protein
MKQVMILRLSRDDDYALQSNICYECMELYCTNCTSSVFLWYCATCDRGYCDRCIPNVLVCDVGNCGIQCTYCKSYADCCTCGYETTKVVLNAPDHVSTAIETGVKIAGIGIFMNAFAVMKYAVQNVWKRKVRPKVRMPHINVTTSVATLVVSVRTVDYENVNRGTLVVLVVLRWRSQLFQKELKN